MDTMVDSDKLPFMRSSLDESESRLLELISECSGRVEGRTKLMKLVFLSEYYNPEEESLQTDERMGVFDDFVIYNHGPFSRDLMDVFNSLKEDGFIEEETELTFTGNRRKIIQLTKEGEQTVDELDLENDIVSTTVSIYGESSASTLEDRSLSLLGITPEEKEDYRLKHVSELIA